MIERFCKVDHVVHLNGKVKSAHDNLASKANKFQILTKFRKMKALMGIILQEGRDRMLDIPR